MKVKTAELLPKKLTMDDAVKFLSVSFTQENTVVSGYIAGYNALLDEVPKRLGDEVDIPDELMGSQQ